MAGFEQKYRSNISNASIKDHLSISAPPNTKVIINGNSFIIGNTGILDLDLKDIIINTLTFDFSLAHTNALETDKNIFKENNFFYTINYIEE